MKITWSILRIFKHCFFMDSLNFIFLNLNYEKTAINEDM